VEGPKIENHFSNMFFTTALLEMFKN
jgi:hypothetical protein